MDEQTYTGSEIAIIGMACRFPKAGNLREYWENLKNGTDCISFFTDEEVIADGIRPEFLSTPNYVKAGGALEGIEYFDASFFGFTPREAQITDPQQRLFLECAWEALENAGYDPHTYPGSIGVYGGMGLGSYLFRLYRSREVLNVVGHLRAVLGNDKDHLPMWVSYKLNLTGPSVNVNTACSTSLVATHLGCQSLLNGECDIALAGAVTINTQQKSGYIYEEGGIFSPDGHCRAFDAGANGTVGSNGVGMVVLKRLDDALRDGDFIHAVIKGSAINNDGSSKIGYTAPSVEGQSKVIAEAIAVSQIDPTSIGYVETHGTATLVGDPVELTALTKAFHQYTDARQFCAIGSVKASIGHVDTAAGMAGMMKTILAMQNGLIPPSLYFERPNPEIDFENTPFFVNTELREWPVNGLPRRAGVSSFGMGGTNSHVIVEEAPRVEPSGPARPWQLLVLSARTPSALETATRNLADFLAGQESSACFADAAYTLQAGRHAFARRRILVCRDAEDAIATLSSLDPKRVWTGGHDAVAPRAVDFLFPGQGAQYPNMGLELYQQEPTFRAWIDRGAELLRQHLGLDLRTVLYPEAGAEDEAARRLERTALAQPALFLIEYALAQLWMEWGIRPQSMIGHSIGEYVAACVAGVLSFEDAVRLVALRGRLMEGLPEGAMLSIPLPEREIAPLLEPEVSLATVNAPSLCVAAGPVDAVLRLEERLRQQGADCRRLHTSHAFHSAMMDPVLAEFAAVLADVELSPPSIPYISNVTGTWITDEEATDPAYWTRHLRQTVRFAEGIAEMLQRSDSALLEVGPGRTLGTFARQSIKGETTRLVLSSLRPPQDQGSDLALLLTALGRLWLHGAPVGWAGFHAPARRLRVPLPTYPFERKRYWIETRQMDVRKVQQAPVSSAEEPERESELLLEARPDLHSSYVAPGSSVQETIARHWQELLGIDKIGIHDNFFELGGHSLLLIQVVSRLQESFNVTLTIGAVAAAQTIEELAQIVEDAGGEAAAGGAVASLPHLEPAPGERHLPFPMTEVQEAYWIGRTGAFELGNVSTHEYFEYESESFDLDRFRTAWQRLIDRHEMLRAIVLPDGLQCILPETPPYEVEVHDLADLPRESAQAEMAAIRHRMSHQVLPSDRWPLFEVRASRLGERHYRLHISIDLLIADAWSVQILSNELALLYFVPRTELAPVEVSFRDYVLAEVAFRDSETYRRSLDYWRERLDTLPSAPELPLVQDPASLAKPRFVRRSGYLGRQAWSRLKARAARASITPSALVLAVFSEVLATWSKSPRFLVNLTLFSRQPVHSQINEVVGDFTSLILLAVDNADAEGGFEARARRIQRQFWQDLEHRFVSGVRVLRELTRRRGGRTASAPVVFTSTLNMTPSAQQESSEPSPAMPGQNVYGISQTPQVWLDHAAGEANGLLVFSWDVVDDLFPPGMVDAMFLAHCGLLERLAESEDAWSAPDLGLLPDADRALQAAANATAAPIPPGLLHDGFHAWADRDPGRPALFAPDRSLTYGELARRSRILALRLRQLGARPNRLVAVVMDKGWEQVVAVLAILEAGAAYLPVSAGLPPERIARLLQAGEVSLALTQSAVAARLDWPEGILPLLVGDEEPGAAPPAPPPAQTAEDLAYVIFTSGSTGVPKGVMIDHRGALNTVADVSSRFDVGPEDRVFGISSLGFDLSVYDIFGTLGAGAALVLPEPEAAREPSRWAEWLAATGVTVWSSVPALMEMLVEHLAGRSERPGSLRLVLLSGDWIPVTLPARIRAIWPEAEVISLGGATEASIWSILYPIGTVDPAWKSIPYGRAMLNQSFHALDEHLEPRPVWVPGELYIGGIGLARGYWKDPEKTSASFIVHPRTGEVLYRTGDFGRWLPDGHLEFLGREDLQVKVQGHRIELGEIEAALTQHPALRAAVVKATGSPRGGKRLVAYVVPAEGIATPPPVPPGSGDTGAPAGIELILDPIAKLEFKMRRPGLRRDLEGSAVELEAAEVGADDLRPYRLRRSFRKFSREPLPLEGLAGLLRVLCPVEWNGRPKFRYPSAGNLYPVQTYLYVKPGRVAELPGGIYYHDPSSHRLVAISMEPDFDGRIFGSDNRPVFEQSAFVLFLIAQHKAVAPIYGSRARDFCVLEAGYLGQLLMTEAPELSLGLCPIGGLEFAPIRERFALEDTHELIHLLAGGGIDVEQALTEMGEDEDYELFQHLLQENAPAPVRTAAAVSHQSAPAARQTPSDVAEDVRAFLRRKLPEYMIPTAFVVLPALPLSPNGKVDRKALPDPDLGEMEAEQGRVAPRTPLEAELARLWAQVLDVEEPGAFDNFFELGGQSLLAARLIARVREVFQVELSLASLFEAPTVAGMAEGVERLRGQAAPVAMPRALPPVVPDPGHRQEPFPLTDLQHAYQVGGSGAFELGIAPLYYAEIEMKDLDVERLARALRLLMDRHEMLRAEIRPDSTQRILADLPAPALDVEDLRELAPDAQGSAVQRIRDEMAQPFAGSPLLRIRVSRLDDARSRIHMAVSLLICDAWSYGLLSRELRLLYADPGRALPPLELSFRDYVLATGGLEETAEYQRAAEYWRRRVPSLPGAPELPLAKSPSAVTCPAFVRRSFGLEQETWRRLKARAAAAGLTPDAVLCTAYAEVLAAWSKQRHFVLTVLYFNRLPLHPQVESVLGNFSSTLLLELDLRAPASFRERARQVQEQLWQDIGHSLFSGIRVLRELNRAQGKAPRAAVPVVFASTLGLRGDAPAGAPQDQEDNLVSSRLQTPQVWLDHQVFELNGRLQGNWDAVEEIFPAGMIESLFGAYCDLLERLGAPEETAWTAPLLRLLPAAQEERQFLANRTDAPLPAALLQDGLAARTAERPQAAAVISSGRTLTYAELDGLAHRLGSELRDLGARPGRVVAIVMEKGWEQVAAAFGILRSGAAYLPVDPSLPRERIQYLLERCGVELAVTQPWVEPALEWPPGVRRLPLDDAETGPASGDPLPAPQRPEDLAYVIFTSGSTGQPKGVMIEHRGAVNTIVDINERFAIGPDDRVLALSALSFDLSVWDLFGTAAAGGSIVLPDAELVREPARLVEWMTRTGVTVWSSVPALMEMLVDHLEARGELLPSSLRLVLLSGDWIPVHLPGRIAALRPGVQTISLGGATEASIWSILHPIVRVDPARPSIPYGRPMLNQRFRVLDERLEPRPDWAVGQLYIGGAGLARGYWGDAERTGASFFLHPRTGERLYRTGDLGRWLPEGEIEFLGREDFQVKIQGYRIELGEIEAALVVHPGVRSAVALALGEKLGHKRLAAFVVPARPQEPPTTEELRVFLHEKLPAYMVPPTLVLLPELPLSANGKVDRAALALLGSPAAEREVRPPRDEMEIHLARLWEEVLETGPIGIEDNFFDLGGDSVVAVRLMSQIQRELGRDLPLATLFENGTIERLAQVLRGPEPASARGPLVRIRPAGSLRPFFCVHPVGGSVLCYVELSRHLGADRPVYGLQSVEAGEATPDRIETMAARYVEAIRQVQPAGPYLLGGWSMGGVIAFEMARQLGQSGETVDLLALIDVAPPNPDDRSSAWDDAALAAWFHRDLTALGASPESLKDGALQRHLGTFKVNALALERYVPQLWSGTIHLFQALDGSHAGPEAAEGWGALARGGARLETLAGDHYSLVREPHVLALAERLRAALADADPQQRSA